MTEHMSMADYRKEVGIVQVKPTKYNNQITYVDGIRFASIAEAERYKALKLLKAAGEVKGFDLQPSFIIGPDMRYIADFIVCGKDGKVWVEDVKGVETAVFKVKRKLWEERYPWMELRVLK